MRRGERVRRGELPVDACKGDILDAVRRCPFVVLCGETGSGKTTQIPQFIADAPWMRGAAVVVTQPRRVAAVSVAQRVAAERGVEVGGEVGYSIRFEDVTSQHTRIKYVTDGTLVKEITEDPLLLRCGCVVLDEAHERAVHTDLLLGLVKQAATQRLAAVVAWEKGARGEGKGDGDRSGDGLGKAPTMLRVLVTSATLDIGRFQAYFGGDTPALTVPGRTFPVQVFHSKQHQIMTVEGPASRAYVGEAVDLALKLHRAQPWGSEGEGHILIFLTGADEIDKACRLLKERLELRGDGVSDQSGGQSGSQSGGEGGRLDVIPLYGMLSAEDQMRAFADKSDHGVGSSYVRKCVVATNIAETSVTIPGVRFVIDPGYVKQKAYDPSRGVESLVIVPTSQVAAAQRAGRAGRTGPGQCFRLYSKEAHGQMMAETVPEILRTHLGSTVLTLKVLGVVDVIGFDFFEPPGEDQLSEALLELFSLGALTSFGEVTALGHSMAGLPLDPRLGRSLVEAMAVGCLASVLVVAALLSSSEPIWHTPKPTRRDGQSSGGEGGGHYGPGGYSGDGSDDHARALAAHARFFHPRGDHLSYLKVWRAWEKEGSFSDTWLRSQWLRTRAMKVAKMTHTQLEGEMGRLRAKEERRTPGRAGDGKGGAGPAGTAPSDGAAPCYTPPAEGGSSGASGAAPLPAASEEALVTQAFCAGYFGSAARRAGDGVFQPLPKLAALQSPSPGQNQGHGKSRLGPAPLAALFVYLSPQSALGQSGAETPGHVIFQELVVAAGKLTIRNVLAVDWPTLRACRAPLDLAPSAASSGQPITVSALCGRAPPRSEGKADGGGVLASRPPGSPAVCTPPALAGTAAQGQSAGRLDAARERFLARKRARSDE